MIGRKLTAQLLAYCGRGSIGLDRLTLADGVDTPVSAAAGIDARAVTGDLTSADLADFSPGRVGSTQ
jgi:hypothetical protein